MKWKNLHMTEQYGAAYSCDDMEITHPRYRARGSQPWVVLRKRSPGTWSDPIIVGGAKSFTEAKRIAAMDLKRWVMS